ncbi:MAG: bis(5'-nucleosyl)-tetraphosphatase (symmetrical) YqeK [Paenibacillaceae bacterium]|nr:bis(5'-nucleosyl)-tetraphosphatase (symmetrical) YqeK [Paenibacillaceae bacterium]
MFPPIQDPEIWHRGDEQLIGIAAYAKAQMTDKRWRHTQGVVVAAHVLAHRHGADVRKATIAAYVHDVAKCWSLEQMRARIAAHDAHDPILDAPPSLWHAHAGALAVHCDVPSVDEDIVNAVKYHTSGRVGMGLLEKVVCVADYIEPGRHFEGVDQIRSEALHSLDRALLLGLSHTIRSLLAEHKHIYEQTVRSRNDMLRIVYPG